MNLVITSKWNFATCLSFCGNRSHITPILEELHWLPIRKGIAYKIALLTFKALHNQAPQYIIELIETYSPPRALRSSSRIMLRHPARRKSSYGQRSFASAAPRVWNDLPVHVRSATSLSQFKSTLKTHLFRSDCNKFWSRCVFQNFFGLV